MEKIFSSNYFCFKTSQTAKLLDSNGNFLQKLNLPLRAAELMLDNPGHVISPADELRKTRRISALRADDELLGGKIYVLEAVGRMNTKVSVSELEMIESAVAGKKKKKVKNGSRVSPATAEEKREEEEEEIKDSDLGFCYRNKRWNPKLESISEDFSVSFREKLN